MQPTGGIIVRVAHHSVVTIAIVQCKKWQIEVNKDQLNRGDHASWTAGVANTFRPVDVTVCLNDGVQPTEMNRQGCDIQLAA